MLTLPAGWTARDYIETLPKIYAHFLSTPVWPPAREGLPAGYAEVSPGWNIRQQLVGNMLPGNVRGEWGFSQASGSITILVDADTVTPWAKNGASRVKPGSRVELYATHGAHDSPVRVPMGTFDVQPISGSVKDGRLDLQLQEADVALRRPNRVPPLLNRSGGTVDASWIVAQLAALEGITDTSIDQLGPRLRVVHFPWKQDAWEVVQQTVAASLGAAWREASGRLVVRGWPALRGDGIPGEPVDAIGNLEDIAWSIDPDDVADRVEVTYRTPVILDSTTEVGGGFPVAWEADTIYELPPGKTVEVLVDLPQASASLLAWAPWWDNEVPTSMRSRWAALPNRDGTGDQPSNTAVSIDMARLSGSRVQLLLRNNSNGTLFTVDRNGDPCLELRADATATLDTEKTLTSGLPIELARSPLSVDLGQFVQREEDAQRVLDLVVKSTAEARYRIDNVKVRLDWRLQRGDIIRLQHAPSGLVVKCLIVGVDLSGSAASIDQTLTLVVLAFNVGDFNTAWAGKTIADFNARWAGKTYADFNADPLSTSA